MRGSDTSQIRTNYYFLYVVFESYHQSFAINFKSIASTRSAFKRRLVRNLRLRRDSCKMAPLATLPVDQGAVLSNPVVPEDNGSGLPLHSDLEVGTVGQMVIEELQNRVRLLLLEADNLASDC